jgi:ribosomal protein S18 acetylase RimI-like enzyme
MLSPAKQETVHRKFKLSLNVNVRSCTSRDRNLLEWFGLFREHRQIIQSTWDAMQRGEQAMLVAIVNDFPVGQVWIDVAKKQAERTGVIWALRVFPFLQGQGIGRELLRAAEAELRRRQFRRAQLGVEKDSAAIAFYESLGYEPIGELYEEYSYTTPDGVSMTVPVDQVLYQKQLDA